LRVVEVAQTKQHLREVLAVVVAVDTVNLHLNHFLPELHIR
jgi:hypothetical protein